MNGAIPPPAGTDEIVRQHLVATALWTASRTLAYALGRGRGLIDAALATELADTAREADRLATTLTEEVAP